MPTFRHATCESILPKWQDHEFYTSSLVLGIDIGLEGIGVFLRRGSQTLYEKTLIYRIPQTNALGQRRQYRAARRCRKNRRTRLKRLEKLFRHHGLPWFEGDDDALTRSDPFLLRHRALTKKLASQEALSICIRHLVTHRGYEYFSDEGEYPWGDEASLSAAVKWVRTAFVDEETAQFLRTECRVIAELAGGKAEEKYQQFCEVLDERLVSAENNPISEVLRDYAAEKRNHIRQRARGYAFPRKLVWSHLEIICRRHADLIGDLEGFLHALGAPSSQKSESIFFYNRKTREEMEAHWAKKVGLCPYASELGLSAKLRRGLRGEMSIRRFSLLEFLASRRLQLADGTLRQVSDACVENLLNWMKAFEAAYQDQAPLPAVKEIRSMIVADLREATGEKLTPDSKSEINAHFFEQIRGIMAPTAGNRRSRASMSSESAAKLYEIATAGGLGHEQIVENLKPYYEWRKRAISDFGLYPQVEFLLGKRRKGGNVQEYAVEGRLQRIFALSEVVEHLDDGQAAPDYCVIEVVGDIPRNERQRREKEGEIRKNRARKEKLFEQYGAAESDTRSAYRRVLLHDQQRGLCPYSGEELGDPLGDHLEIDHIFPQKRGGISVTENLILTFKKLNLQKGNRTPREAARSLDGWDWRSMNTATARMKWNGRKREIFEWDEPAGLPDFGNLTRTSQLARQLVAECAHWMGIGGEPDEIQRRIGTPSGYLRAQALRSWQEKIPVKDRSDLVHHLVDAAVVAHIPPGPGLNQVACGGIFYPESVPGRDRTRLAALPLGPDLTRWMTDEPLECPVMRHRSSSKYRPLHNTTLLRVREDGTLWSRKPLPEKGGIPDAAALKAMLAVSGIPGDKIPSSQVLNKWLDSSGDAPLRLTDGTPVKSIWALNPKGNFHPPFGVTAKRDCDGAIREAKIIIEKFDALEIWRGVVPEGRKAGQPIYQKRLVPVESALLALTRLGYSWRKAKAPAEFQKHPDRPETHQTLREIICGSLLPYSKRKHVFRKGQTYRIGLTNEGEIAPRGQKPYWHCWYYVSALKTSTQVKFEALQFRDKEKTPLSHLSRNFLVQSKSSSDVLAQIAGLPALNDSSPDSSG